jgi:putative membrane protein
LGCVSDPPSSAVDASRRTWLAAERTWLAWWRSGVAVGAVALAVGRFLPGLTHGTRWPYEALGVGYGLLSVATLLVGGLRQQRAADALRRGTLEELTTQTVAWLTAAAIVLSLVSTVLVIVL